jgi:segregation and condensation protein A
LDINDIPIAQITNDFLDYIRHLEALDIDVASEFILVAATLMRIKAKMLIPRKEIDEEGNEIDPREELAQKLIEYRKYKSIIDEMSALEENRHFRHSRGNVSAELKEIAEKALVDIELESLNLYKLLQTFQQLMKRYEDDLNKPKHQIVKFEYTIEDQQNYILHQLKREKKVKFQDVFLKLENRIQAIVTFIALLELLNLQTVNLVQGEGVNNFWLAAV